MLARRLARGRWGMGCADYEVREADDGPVGGGVVGYYKAHGWCPRGFLDSLRGGVL